MRLYFDTNSWMRPFQKNSENTIEEATAIEMIWENCCESYEIITSQYQINYFEGTQHSLRLDDKTKDAFAKAYAVCLSLTNERKSGDPYCQSEIDEFYKKVQNKDTEDRKHIVIAWRKEANYFITADRELYEHKKKIIEETLNAMWHPTISGHNHEMIIMNPKQFIQQFMRKS